jgi:CcmD family protein
MSEWFYIWLALGITWAVLGGYMLLLNRRRVAAERAVREIGSGGGDR